MVKEQRHAQLRGAPQHRGLSAAPPAARCYLVINPCLLPPAPERCDGSPLLTAQAPAGMQPGRTIVDPVAPGMRGNQVLPPCGTGFRDLGFDRGRGMHHKNSLQYSTGEVSALDRWCSECGTVSCGPQDVL